MQVDQRKRADLRGKEGDDMIIASLEGWKEGVARSLLASLETGRPRRSLIMKYPSSSPVQEIAWVQG